ncbi:peptide-methionine (S)-S-oxide reductase [archaeon CG10_big_fil_rev_8_21_14_0_10_43_11]|nr:MAG: peptide-methionine (S)-S-oxide reductase [archaeon CG10_big_fil_rev_8_21_14_0_10_43_11]
MEVATFGAGCFWHVEADFRKIKGVTNVVVGYMGGHTQNPRYDEVCSDKTGHVEVAQITFNPKKVSYAQLLDVFWTIHDPTQINRQGLDVGTQYRTVIYYHSEEQKREAEASKKALDASKKFKKPIATAIVPAETFYRAEEYHQQYYKKQGNVC